MLAEDEYRTFAESCQTIYKEKSSKFITYGFVVRTEQEIAEALDELHKKHYDATHHCYAWRLGFEADRFRANDDGEPSGTAGKPILGQLVAAEMTNVLVVVVRYFGGTKLGVGGLISAYKESTAQLIAESEVITLTKNAIYEIGFGYLVMNDVMKIVKDLQPRIIKQNFDNSCSMTLSIRSGMEQIMCGKLDGIEGLHLRFIEYA